MKGRIKDIKSINKIRFDETCEAIHMLIKKYWDVSAQPKNYDTDDYSDDNDEYDDMQQQAELMRTDFNGYDDGTCYSYPLTESLTNVNVAYNENEQYIKPLETLIGAIFHYGFEMGQKYKELDNEEINELNREILKRLNNDEKNK